MPRAKTLGELFQQNGIGEEEQAALARSLHKVIPIRGEIAQ